MRIAHANESQRACHFQQEHHGGNLRRGAGRHSGHISFAYPTADQLGRFESRERFHDSAEVCQDLVDRRRGGIRGYVLWNCNLLRRGWGGVACPCGRRRRCGGRGGQDCNRLGLDAVTVAGRPSEGGVDERCEHGAFLQVRDDWLCACATGHCPCQLKLLRVERLQAHGYRGTGRSETG